MKTRVLAAGAASVIVVLAFCATSVGASAAPRGAVVVSARSGLVFDKGDRLHLPGLHPRGVRVLRGHLPVILAMRLALANLSDARLTVPVVYKYVTQGGRAIPRGAFEDAVVILRIAKKPENSVERPILYTRAKRHRVTRSGIVDEVFLLPRWVAVALRRMSSAARGRVVEVLVRQHVSVDGRGTVTDTKTAAATLAFSHARSQGMTIHFTILDSPVTTPQGHMYIPMNVVVNPDVCVYADGSGGSDFSNLSGSVLGGAELEGTIEADGSPFDNPSYPGYTPTSFDSIVLNGILGKALGYVAGKMGNPFLTLYKTLYNVGTWLSNSCQFEPSVINVAAADPNGGTTSQAYVITQGVGATTASAATRANTNLIDAWSLWWSDYPTFGLPYTPPLGSNYSAQYALSGYGSQEQKLLAPFLYGDILNPVGAQEYPSGANRIGGDNGLSISSNAASEYASQSIISTPTANVTLTIYVGVGTSTVFARKLKKKAAPGVQPTPFQQIVMSQQAFNSYIDSWNNGNTGTLINGGSNVPLGIPGVKGSG